MILLTTGMLKVAFQSSASGKVVFPLPFLFVADLQSSSRTFHLRYKATPASKHAIEELCEDSARVGRQVRAEARSAPKGAAVEELRPMVDLRKEQQRNTCCGTLIGREVIPSCPQQR
jgi:hypothetical protein